MNTEMTFTATPLYRVSPDATRVTLWDQLTAKLDQLCAMLSMITGDGLENFQNANDHTQHMYLWNCAMSADECQELLTLLGSMRRDNERDGSRLDSAPWSDTVSSPATKGEPA